MKRDVFSDACEVWSPWLYLLMTEEVVHVYIFCIASFEGQIQGLGHLYLSTTSYELC